MDDGLSRSPPVLGAGARPVMCYPDPHSAAGPNGGVAFRCYGMAMLQDSAEAVRGAILLDVHQSFINFQGFS